MKWFRPWWQNTSKTLKIIQIGAFIAVLLLIYAGYQISWTGFQNKTLWDWLNLLGVLAIPVVVGLGAAWYTAQQGKVSDSENRDNQREAALQGYIDSMSELLLHEKLRDSAEEDEVRKIARVRTLTVLPRLDKKRKASALQFLHEAGLIEKGRKIVHLDGADLVEADLTFADLCNADLSNTILRGASLFVAKLRNADLRETGLPEARLTGADLTEANLSVAYLMKADLTGANLTGVILLEADMHDANLTGAILQGAMLLKTNLQGADLSGADLSATPLYLLKQNDSGLVEANLTGADLTGANLTRAKVTTEQLDKAASLKGTTLPDGTKHA